ncbi:MAG: TonB-dependent receptor [Hyphomicrobiaceae bacterium]
MWGCRTGRTAVLAMLMLAGAVDEGRAQGTGATPLEGIIIQSGDLGLAPSDSGTSGTAVTVVSGEQLRRQQVRHVSDALRLVPGLSVSRSGNPAGVTQVRVRGAEGNHVLVMIDGVKANDTPTGEFDFSDLLVGDIERIEVLRGPQSGLWGSNALAGVINVVTRGGKGPARATLTAEAGAFDMRRVAMALRGGTEAAWGSLSFISYEIGGYNLATFGSERDPARQSSFAANGGFRLSPFFSVFGGVRAMSKSFGFDDFGTPPGAVPGGFTPQILVDAPNRGRKETRVAYATAQLELLDGRWVQKLTGSFSESDDRSLLPGFTFQAGGERRRLTYTSRLAFEVPGLSGVKHAVTGLAEKEWEDFTTSNTFAPAAIERRRLLDSLALQYTGEVGRMLSLKAAVRLDDSSAFGRFDTWSLSASYTMKPTGSRLHASVGTGVVLPSMYEQFGEFPGFFTPNPDLRPERSFGWDVGIEQPFLDGRVVVDVTYFDQDLQDEIFSSFAGPPRNLTGRSDRRGVEVSGRIKPMPGLTIHTSYTFLDARDGDGLVEVRRPRHAASADAIWTFAGDKARVGLGVVFNGRMRDVVRDAFTFAEGRVVLGDYTLVRLTGSYRLTEQLELFARVENLLDQRYQEIYGVNTPGLAAYAGLRLRLEERAQASRPGR